MVFTTVLIGSVLIGLAALVTDVGSLYLTKNQLYNMSEAGALAGAQEWFIGDKEQVESIATNYALDKNGKTGDVIDVDVLETDKKIIVTSTRTLNLFLAKIFNNNSATVSAKAAARIVPVSKMASLAPFGVVKENLPLQYNQPYTLKVDNDESTSGNFHLLDFTPKDGQGGQVYRNILLGSKDVYAIGSDLLLSVDTKTGGTVGQVRQGVADRIAINPIVIVPIVETFDVNGKKTVKILGFAAFELNISDGKTVTGQYIKMVTSAEDLVTEEDREANYELYGTQLIDPNL